MSERFHFAENWGIRYTDIHTCYIIAILLRLPMYTILTFTKSNQILLLLLTALMSVIPDYMYIGYQPTINTPATQISTVNYCLHLWWCKIYRGDMETSWHISEYNHHQACISHHLYTADNNKEEISRYWIARPLYWVWCDSRRFHCWGYRQVQKGNPCAMITQTSWKIHSLQKTRSHTPTMSHGDPTISHEDPNYEPWRPQLWAMKIPTMYKPWRPQLWAMKIPTMSHENPNYVWAMKTPTMSHEDPNNEPWRPQQWAMKTPTMSHEDPNEDDKYSED